jgi:predicted acetyltransferase
VNHSLSSVTVTRALPTERALLQRMLEFYQHDLSDIWDQDLDARGEFGYSLDRYWQAPACSPYILRVAGHAAGFALVDGQVKLPGGDYWMDQFFVMKRYRGKGVGRAAAAQVFALHPGSWQVGQMTANLAAQAFWRRTISELFAGNYTEVEITAGWWQGFVQSFRSSSETITNAKNQSALDTTRPR